MEIKYEPMRKGMTQRDIAQLKALDYIAKCNRKETETNEMADSLVGGLLCVAIGIVTYLLVYNGIIL